MIKIINRSMSIPIPDRVIGHVGDNLVEIRSFELNRYYGEVDLSEFSFKLDTEINGTKNIIDLDKSVTEDKITLTWTVHGSHVLHVGRMTIQLRAFHDDIEKWHSAQDYVIIQDSINAPDAYSSLLPSEFEQMELRVTTLKEQAEASAQTATEQANRAQGIADEFENETLPAAIAAVEAAVDEQVDIAASHADRAQGIADTFSNTTLPAAISAVEAAGQAKVDLAEQQAERVEDIIQEAEQDVLPELRQAIEDGLETKDQLGGSIQEAGEAKTALDGSISSAGTAKGELDGSISSAGVAKTQLDGSISSANGIKSQLDGSITAAGQAKELLDESIATGDLANFKAEFQSHKNDYASYKDSNSLKVAKVEKELNDYQQTMVSMNVNQEAKQTASGYEIVSLPKNAANGQVSVSVKGNTETDEEGNTKSTVSASRLKSVGKNLFDKISAIQNKYVKRSDGLLGNSVGYYASDFISVKPNTAYVFTNFVVTGAAGAVSYDVNKNFIVDLSPNGNRTVTTPSNAAFIRFSIMSGNIDTAQFELGTLATPYEPYTESTQYITAKDSNGNIIELRSLPNGTKDEINVTNGKATIRIGHKTDVASNTVIDYANMVTGGQYYAWNDDGETETGVKGDTLGIDATTLTYQLATPIEIPIEVSGTLMSYPSGTIYVENAVADAGIYTDKFTILQQDLPIKEIEKISKVDFTMGIETELDVSQAVIVTDKLSFTHPDLSEGDIVFFEYEYDVESTEGETEVEYYDSRYVVKDDVTGKFYKWNVKVSNGTPTIEVVEV